MAKKTIVKDYSEQQIKQIALYYELAQTKLSNLITNAIQIGDIDNAASLTKTRKEIALILNQLQLNSFPLAQQIVTTSYTTASALAANALYKQTKGKMSVDNLNKKDLQAIEILVLNLQNKIVDLNVQIGRRTEDAIRQISLKQIALEKVANNDQASAKKAIIADLASAGFTKAEDNFRLIQIGGKNLQVAKYAEMVVRTTSREAATNSVIQRVIEAGTDLVKVSEHEHGEDICSEYEGKIYSVSGKSKIYPLLDVAPPYHPNCVHVLLPYVEL